jgi:Glycosyl hydrolase 108
VKWYFATIPTASPTSAEAIGSNHRLRQPSIAANNLRIRRLKLSRADGPRESKMADRFEPCLEFTLREEGGYVDDAADPGGAANMGITLATYREWSDNPISARRRSKT